MILDFFDILFSFFPGDTGERRAAIADSEDPDAKRTGFEPAKWRTNEPDVVAGKIRPQ